MKIVINIDPVILEYKVFSAVSSAEHQFLANRKRELQWNNSEIVIPNFVAALIGNTVDEWIRSGME